jgi:NADPH:quinone reductase-like Zn-dependent oxidoreductase
VRAIRLRAPGGSEQLFLEELETPRPGAGEALVRVHAAAITRDELEWPVDRLPATPSYELSGVIEQVGRGVEHVVAGDAVYALTGFDRDGVAADYALVRAEHLAPKPRSLGHVQAAAVPMAGLSAWQGLFDHGRLSEGERVLVHGAAGGVGHLAVQLAARRGAHVIGTASTSNLDLVRELGAHEVVDHTGTRFEEVVEPVDVVFDTAGGERLARSPSVLSPGGRLVSIAEEPPPTEERGVRAVYFVVEPSREQLAELARLVDAGDLRPAIAEIFPLEEARAAFERGLSGDRRGKIVLSVAGDDG